MCSSPIGMDNKHVLLAPCGCSACFDCLLNAHVDCGTSLLTCQKCDMLVTSHQFHKSCLSIEKRKNYHTNEEVINVGVMKRTHPLKYLGQQEWDNITSAPADESAKAIVLYAAVISKDAGADSSPKVDSTIKTFHHIGNGNSLAYNKQLSEFSAFLYPHITKLSITPSDEISTLDPGGIFKHATPYKVNVQRKMCL